MSGIAENKANPDSTKLVARTTEAGNQDCNHTD